MRDTPACHRMLVHVCMSAYTLKPERIHMCWVQINGVLACRACNIGKETGPGRDGA